MVPSKVREAAIGHGGHSGADCVDGASSRRLSGDPDGSHAGVARGAGETAPLLFTSLFSNFWFGAGGNMSLMQPTASLAVLIYNFSAMPFKNQVELAWAAALVLVLMVLTVNLIGQALSRSRTSN